MNINTPWKPLEPLKVFVVNPLAPASQLFIVKMMSGYVFGKDQLINLNLVVYTNDMKSAEGFKLELESCAFSSTNSIKVSSDLPSVTEGDVFCFMTDFDNPNCIEFHKEDIDEQFNALYLIIKLANSFSWPNETDDKQQETTKNINFKKNSVKHATLTMLKEHKKPIFLADGIVVISILQSLSKNMPTDIFFCPTPITAIAKSVLGDYLNVHCNVINNILVWAANDKVFHIEVEKPLIIHDDVSGDSHCSQDKVIGKDLLESLNLDSTQFSASWLKKEFIDKVASSASKNPYGCIYRAVELSKTLRDIWLTRIQRGKKVYNNMGVISDGSLGTIKGHAYVLPIVFNNGSWSVDKRYEEDIHLKQEIKRINEEVKLRHNLVMISYCKKILQEHIINQPCSDEDGSSSSSKY